MLLGWKRRDDLKVCSSLGGEGEVFLASSHVKGNSHTLAFSKFPEKSSSCSFSFFPDLGMDKVQNFSIQWLSLCSIVLRFAFYEKLFPSPLLSSYSPVSRPPSSPAVGPRDGVFELGILRSLVKESGLDDLLYLITQIVFKRQS